MCNPALLFDAPITLVGGAEVSAKNFRESMQFASTAVAADGGANTCLRYGINPAAVIGDLDSIDEYSKTQIKQDLIHFISDQDDTDFEKALKRIHAPLILGVGFLGDRADHQMAAQTALVKNFNKKVVLIGSHDLIFLTPPDFSLTLGNMCRISLYPMGECSIGSLGLKWNTEGIEFSPSSTIGTSNHTTRDKIELHPSKPLVLTIVPREFLAATCVALKSSKNWPI